MMMLMMKCRLEVCREEIDENKRERIGMSAGE